MKQCSVEQTKSMLAGVQLTSYIAIRVQKKDSQRVQLSTDPKGASEDLCNDILFEDNSQYEFVNGYNKKFSKHQALL